MYTRRRQSKRSDTKNWRQISLHKLGYEIDSTYITNLSKIVLLSLIHEDKTGFMTNKSLEITFAKYMINLAT